MTFSSEDKDADSKKALLPLPLPLPLPLSGMKKLHGDEDFVNRNSVADIGEY